MTVVKSAAGGYLDLGHYFESRYHSFHRDMSLSVYAVAFDGTKCACLAAVRYGIYNHHFAYFDCKADAVASETPLMALANDASLL
mmetsp:Transcript_13685/g.27901  ORF Transcript_13685/g.27901 Transcript_13685/m.27901 type:complete len:85 (+) Transcript_13685:365-619(+)